MSTTTHSITNSITNSSAHSSANLDGTLTAYTEEGLSLGRFEPGVGFGLLRMLVPFEADPTVIAGRYFLARCGAQSAVERATQWGIYFRRPLFLANYQLLPVDNPVQTAAGDETSSASTPKRVAECQFVIPYQPFTSNELYPYNAPDFSPTALTEQGLDAQNNPPAAALPLIADPGYAWLAALGNEEPVNLMGPFGNGFELGPECRNLLLIASGGRIARLLPLIEVMLNRGGRVTIVIKAASDQAQEALRAYLLPMLPIAVELRLAHTDKGWTEQLNETLTWADQICAALPESELNGLTMRIRDRRFHLQEGFAQVLVDADLICGVGACLACVVNTAHGGHTRACANGPVFDLIKLAR